MEKIGPPKDLDAIDMDVANSKMAFPVFKAIPNSRQNNSHKVFAWKIV